MGGKKHRIGFLRALRMLVLILTNLAEVLEDLGSVNPEAELELLATDKEYAHNAARAMRMSQLTRTEYDNGGTTLYQARRQMQLREIATWIQARSARVTGYDTAVRWSENLARWGTLNGAWILYRDDSGEFHALVSHGRSMLLGDYHHVPSSAYIPIVHISSDKFEPATAAG